MKAIRFCLSVFIGFAVAAYGISCLSSDSNQNPVVPVGVTIPFHIVSNGIDRTYLLRVPPAENLHGLAPLVLNFHGLTSTGAEQEILSGMSPAADALGIFVAYPDGISNHWNVTATDSGDDVQFVRDIIREISSHYGIDSNRIYATGMSNGGGMTNRLACDADDIIAAVSTVSGAYNGWNTCNPSRTMPVLSFHGLDDDVAPYNGVGLGNVLPPIRDWAAAWGMRNGCSATPTVVLQTTTMKVERWDGCQSGGAVVLYTLDNHSHSWPGSTYLPVLTSQEINATDTMLAFFLEHVMRR